MDILEKATERRTSLQERRRRLVAQVEGVDAELRDLEAFFKVAANLQDDSAKPQIINPLLNPAAAWPFPSGRGGSEAAPILAPHGNKTRFIVREARRIIQEQGALPARRILQILDDKGLGSVLIPGMDEKRRVSYLSAVLSKNERFASNRDAGGYVLVETKEKAPQGDNQEGLNDGDDLI